MSDTNAFERLIASVAGEAIGPTRPVDVDSVTRSAVNSTAPLRAPVVTRTPGAVPQSRPERGLSMFSAAKLVAAATIIALLGGFILAGVLDAPEEPLPPAAEDEPVSRPPVRSAGCGNADTGDIAKIGFMDLDGERRIWQIRVPKALDGETPLPLWVHLHGGLQSEQGAAFRSVDEFGLVAVAPIGSRDKGMGRLSTGWMWGDTDAAIDLTLDNPDTAFVNALIDRLGDELCLDLARVYASGYSDGADGVAVLACALEDRIAAFAATAGVVDLGDACEQGRPVPLLGVHGRTDVNLPFEGGSMREVWNTLPISKELRRLPVPDRLTQAAVRNGCGTEPTIEPIVDGVERWTWPCPVGAEIELVLHPGAHSWRLGTTEMDVDDLVWEFFEQHPMPE